MSFEKFMIMNQNEAHQSSEVVEMLINVGHIVSLKPIRMATTDQKVVEGYWLRLSNGKKYKAVQVPKSLKLKLEEDMPAPTFVTESQYEEQLQ
ncbi:MAG: hypothetical protein KC478_03955 [Bacteriovoracaceae bacterium]|nr:hypothetical protein [Bacteriovoracaceae bacterium]